MERRTMLLAKVNQLKALIQEEEDAYFKAIEDGKDFEEIRAIKERIISIPA